MSCKSYILILFLFLSKGIHAQVFQNATTVTIPAGYTNLANSIAVTGLATSLNGTTLGVQQVELTISSTNQFNRIEIFLISPSNRMARLFAGLAAGPNPAPFNGTLIFNMAPANTDIRNWPPVSPPPATSFFPDVSLNSLNDGSNPNGTWKLFARVNNFISSGNSITNFKLTFGTTNISPLIANDDCSGATSLVNTKTAGAFISGTNKGYGSSLPNVDKGSFVCSSSPYSENTAWYTWTAACTDDSIVIMTNGGVQTGIVKGVCTGPTLVQCNQQNVTYHTFKALGLTPGTRYYLIFDGDEALGVTYEIRYYPGGCFLPITLLNFNAEFDPSTSLINLNWKTAMENNNKGFNVEARLVSGEEGFIEMGFVTAHNIESGAAYLFNFKQETAGLYEIRLIQEDINGTKTTYPSSFVTVGNEKETLQVYYTNDHAPAATFYLAEPERIYYDLINLNGIKIFSSSISGTPGYNHLDISFPLPSAVYFLQAHASKKASTKKIVVIH